MATTIEMNQQIQILKIIDNIYMCVCVCVCVTTQQRNIREICVIIKRIFQMLELLRCQKILKNHKIYFL